LEVSDMDLEKRQMVQIFDFNVSIF